MTRSAPASGQFTWETQLTLKQAASVGNFSSFDTAWADAVQLTGAQGTDGTDAKTAILSADSLVFKANSANVVQTPDAIRLDVLKQNTAANVTWSTLPSVNLYTAATGGSLVTQGSAVAASTAYLRKADFGSNTSVKITTTCDGLTDYVTLLRTVDGVDAPVVAVNNPSHALPSDSAGTVTVASPYAGSGTTLQVFVSGVACTITGVLRTGTGITPGAASGTGTTTATIAAHSTITADPARVEYAITYTKPDGTSGTVYAAQAIYKQKEGGAGSSAINGTLTKESYLIPSLQDGTGYAGYLSAGGGTFKVTFGTTDVTTSSVFNIVGGTDGGATWTKVQNGLTFTINETTGVYSLSGAAWTSDSENFTVTATYSGTAVTKIYTITKAKQGLPGKKTVVVKVFKWGTSAVLPAEDSTYNWSTNTLSLGSLTGWATTVPSSTASGQKLYELSKLLIVNSDYASTSTVNWDTAQNTTDIVSPVGVINEIGIRQDGSIGPTGPRGQTGYVYYTLESATAPTPTPTASSFNFSTGAFTGLTANWATTYNVPSPTATTTNEKYWSSRYVVSEATFGGTQTITFSDPFVHTNFDGLVTFTNLANSTNGSGATSTTLIDGGGIKTGTVTADKIITTSLSAIQSNLGTVEIATSGYVRSGKTTASDGTNAGFFLGYTSPTYTFFIGNAGDTVSLKYDGNLTMKGGTVNVGTTGAVYGGKSTYASTTAGFFLGYDSSSYKLKIGDASSSLAWDGSALAVVGGTITGGVIRTGSGTTRVEMSSATNDLVAYRAGVKIVDLGNNGDDTVLNVLGWSNSSLKPSVVFKNDFGGTALKVVSRLTGSNAGIGAVLQSKGSYALIVEPEGSTGSEAATTPLSLFQTSSSRPNSSAARFYGGTTSNAIQVESPATTGGYYAADIYSTTGASGARVTVNTSGWALTCSNSGSGVGASVSSSSGNAVQATNNSSTNSTTKLTNNNSAGVALEAIGRVEASKTLRVTGTQPPSSGEGLELAYSGGIGYVTSYNRSTSASRPLHMISSETVLGGVANVPATATSAGTPGQIAWDANYAYFCTAPNTWRRAALSNW